MKRMWPRGVISRIRARRLTFTLRYHGSPETKGLSTAMQRRDDDDVEAEEQTKDCSKEEENV